jgi:hypothetical protein
MVGMARKNRRRVERRKKQDRKVMITIGGLMAAMFIAIIVIRGCQ